MRIPKRSTYVLCIRNFRLWIAGLAFAALSADVTPVRATEILYSDNFSGSAAANLAGTTPDTTIGTNTWQGNTGFKADGSITPFEGGIYLPFTAAPGYIYTMTVSFVTASSSTGWIGAGFSGGSPSSVAPLHTNQGRGWVIVHKGLDPDGVESFIGPGLENKQTTLQIVDPSNQLSILTITLNASSANAANWTFSSSLRVNTTDYVVMTNVNANVTSASQITAVGLSAIDGTGQFTSFSVVPEPSTYVLGVLSGVLIVTLSRHRTRTALAV